MYIGICGQVVIIVCLIFAFIFFMHIKYIVKKIRDNKNNSKIKLIWLKHIKSKHIKMIKECFQHNVKEVYVALFIFIVVLSLINLMFLVMKRCSFIFESVLNYNEAQAMIVAALVAGAIAFFQFKMQKLLNKKNEEDSTQKQKWHRDELENAHLSSLIDKKNIKLIGINFYLNSSKIYLPEMNKNYSGHYIKMISKDGLGFFRDDDQVKIKKVYVNNKKSKCKYVNDDIDGNALMIPVEELNDFFVFPLQISRHYEHFAHNVNLKIIGKVSNKGIRCSCNQKNENDFLKFGFKCNLVIVPDSGYKRDGTFQIKILDFHLKKYDINN